MSCIPVDEGNEECRECKWFDLSYGCVPTHGKYGLPPCGRNIILAQETYLKIQPKWRQNKCRKEREKLSETILTSM